MNGTLSVSILSLNDTGMYTCVARNPHGEDTRDFDVVVKGETAFSFSLFLFRYWLIDGCGFELFLYL